MLASKDKTGSAARARVIVTTSWDDDAASGLKVAELLGSRAMPGTFFVPTGELGEAGKFNDRDLRSLASAGFEIGAHTVSHKMLTTLAEAELVREVGDCKQTLQQILGREVTTFCYPKGRFNAQVIRQVERAGYLGARTTKMLSSSLVFSRFEMPTTIQAYPHSRSNYVKNLVRLRAVPTLAKELPDLISFEGWSQLGKKLFDQALHDGGIWHLYGHPWEIERLNLWSQLANMLDYVAKREGVTYLTNGQILKEMQPQGRAAHDVVASDRKHTLVH